MHCIPMIEDATSSLLQSFLAHTLGLSVPGSEPLRTGTNDANAERVSVR